MSGLAPAAAEAMAPPAAPLPRVVAIGASAGGVTTLPLVLAALPRALRAAVLIVVHLDPDARSYLAPLLARSSRLPVREACEGDGIEPGVVYVASPGAHLALLDGRLALRDTPRVHFSRPSVDVLFQSVAAACGARAVGVILTGAGVDGAEGLRAIKAAGGYTIVQDPAGADHRGMPAAAIATGCADVILPVTLIADAVAAVVDGSPEAPVG